MKKMKKKTKIKEWIGSGKPITDPPAKIDVDTDKKTKSWFKWGKIHTFEKPPKIIKKIKIDKEVRK